MLRWIKSRPKEMEMIQIDFLTLSQSFVIERDCVGDGDRGAGGDTMFLIHPNK